ncbi:PAS domain S-box protein, partial [bacterium]|nr:PAS domain S-box protein [bacterium]
CVQISPALPFPEGDVTEALRKSGIVILGDIPWGSNICQFYSTRDDLSEILVPYVLAGLENNEYCIWVTSEPLTDLDAEECLRKASPHFDRYMSEGRIEIIPHTGCYLDDGRFNPEKAFHNWMEMIDRAIKKGGAGIRATANTSWIRQDEWESFIEYKQNVDRVIGSLPMIAICSYSLDRCSPEGTIDMICNHQLSMAKREGSWALIENSRGKHISDALRESEDRYRSLVESSPDGIIVHREGKLLYANPMALRISGASSLDQVRSMNVLDLITPEDRDSVSTRMRQVMSEGRKIPLRETTIMGLDGSIRPVETMGWAILYQGEPAMQSIIRDISQRKKAQEQTATRSAELEATFAAQNEAVLIYDTEMNVRRVNPCFQETYGFDPCGMNVRDIISRVSCRMLDGSPFNLENQPTPRALRGEKVKGIRFLVKRADGSDVVIETSAGPMYVDGSIIGAVTVWHDITDLIKAEKDLLRSMSRFELLTETASSLLQVSEPGKTVAALCKKVMEHLACNVFIIFLTDNPMDKPALTAWAGISSKEAKCIERIDYENTICGCSAREASRIVVEHLLTTDDDRTKLLRSFGIRAFACHPLLGEDGDVFGTLAFGTKGRDTFSEEDLSLMKAVVDQVAAAMMRLRNEQELRRSENRYRNLVELSPDAVYINRDGRIVMLNPATIRLFGAKTPSQITDKPVIELFHPDCHDIVKERHRKLKEGITILHSEEKIICMDGTFRDVDVTATPIVDSEEFAFQVILHDVTDRKKREEELHKLNRTLHALSQSNQAMIRATDEYSFLQDACRIIVEDCGYSMTWIGYAQEDEKKWVLPMASAGLENGYLDNLKISWDEDADQTRDPTGLAIRTGKPVFCTDIQAEPSLAPWREEALKRGYASSLAIPLMAGSRAIGALTVYSMKPDSFTGDEAVLLTELSNDLSYGLTMLRLNAAAANVEEALR